MTEFKLIKLIKKKKLKFKLVFLNQSSSCDGFPSNIVIKFIYEKYRYIPCTFSQILNNLFFGTSTYFEADELIAIANKLKELNREVVY